MDNGEHYDRALVPEHLTGLTIENLPLDEAFFIFPEGDNGYSPPTVFVGANRELVINRDYDIDMDTKKPGTPVGRVGVMRTMVIHPDTNEVTEHIIADLRFVEWHSLTHVDNGPQDISDQESFMALVDLVAQGLVVDAFIAPDKDFNYEKDKKIPKGTFFGPSELYPNLDKLQERGSKLMKKFLSREAGAQAKPIEERQGRASRFMKQILRRGSNSTTNTGKPTKTKEKPSKADKSKKPAQDPSTKFNGPSNP